MDRFLAIGGRINSDEKYPCVVCSLETSSVDELHNHQKYRHTAEELSLSIICLVHYMCLKNESLGYSGGGKDSFTTLSEDENKGDHPRASEYERGRTCGGTSSPFNAPINNYQLFEKRMMSSWDSELGGVREISDETFLDGVRGICKDLEDIRRMRQTRNFKKLKDRVDPVVKRRGGTKLENRFYAPIDYRIDKERNRPMQNIQRLESFAEAFGSVGNSALGKATTGIPLLQNEAMLFSYNQNQRQMPVLKPYLNIEQILHPDLQ